MSDPRTPSPPPGDGEEGKGKGPRRMKYVIMDKEIVERAMLLRGLSIKAVSIASNTSPQTVRRALAEMPMRASTAIAIWNAIQKHPVAAEGFDTVFRKAEAVG